MKHLGDITKISGREVEAVEVIIGGSPCQDLSVAGKRAGLDGERSGLFMEQIRIIKEMRENDRRAGRTDEFIRPRFMVWENVPGAFSSNGGEDFRTVLEETAKIADPEISIPRPPHGKWTNAGCIMGRGYSIAWRVLDAQYYGVPQRRRRIALVADFGGQCAPEILFERDSLQGDFTESREKGQRAAADAQSGIDTAISFQERAGCAGGVKASSSSTTEQEPCQPLTIKECYAKTTRPHSIEEAPTIKRVDVAPTLNTFDIGEARTSVYCISAFESNSMKSSNPYSGIYKADTSRTLDNNGGNPACNQDGMIIVQSTGGEIADTLDASYYKGPGRRGDKERTVVCVLCDRKSPSGQQGEIERSDGPGIDEQNGHGGGNVPMLYDTDNLIVRRLTPLEAERLQGYPMIRKVMCTEMTKDEYIAWNISEGNIIVDTERGKIYAMRGPGGVKLKTPKELKGSVVKGYKVINIRNMDTKMQCKAHRIIWIAKHGIIPAGYVIDHINNDKQDNRICNLQLLTPSDNSKKARKDGLYKIHGEAGQAKISDEVHDLIQYIYGSSDLSLRQLSNCFGISKSRISQIIHEEPWTDIGEWTDSKGKKHKDADSPRYKALGNSIAVPCWRFILRNINEHCTEHTMASLFSGIGGFELCSLQVGITPIWSSEIEEFCVAVTKKHFGEGDEKGDYEQYL